MDQDHPPEDDEVNAEPAYILEPRIAYVRGWTHAARAAAGLDKELRACGLTLPYLHAEVNVFGVGMIELGRISPETARTLADLLAETRTATKAPGSGDEHAA